MNTTAVKEAAAWKIKANKETDDKATSVEGGNIVTFKAKDGGNSGDTIKITRNGRELTFEANFATIRTPGTGMVNVDNDVKDNWLAKAKNVAAAINASGWTLQANGNNVGLINPGDKVNIATDEGSGITINKINEADKVSTIKLKANVTGLTAGENITISNNDGNYTIKAIDTNTQASVSPKSGSPITVTKTTTTPNSPDYAVGLDIDDKTLEIKGGKLAARTQAQAIESVEKKDVEDNIAEVDVKSGSTKGTANAVYTVAVTKSAVKDAAAWNIKEGSETTSTAVKGGDTLTLSDTNTIDVVHNGKDFTFNAKTATIQTEQKQAITKIDVSNEGITTKTTGGNNTPTGRFIVPTGNDTDKHALATAYDVADKVNQTGWNLYTNGGAPILINPGDYVNFKSGKATNANIVTEASEGATISYDVNVDNTTIKIDPNGNKLTANTGDVDSVTNTEGNSKKGQVTIHKDPLEPSKTDSGKLATVDTVVKAVNNAKWFTIAKDSDDKVTGETKTNESEGTAMAAGETLGLNAGKNLRLKREANTNNFTFALDSNLKDLDSVHTKEIKLGESNNPISIKNDGDRITYTTKGGNNSDVTHKVANLEDEKHIKPTTDGNEYTVDASGNITMTYADGNNKDVTNTKAVIKGVAKNDLSNITNDGKRAITTLGSVVKAGDNVLVDEDTDAVTGKKTYTVNAVTPVVYTDKQGNRVYKVKDGNGYKFTKNADGTGEVVNKSDVIASFYDGNNSTTAGTMIVNNIGSAIKNVTVPAGKDANNFLNKLEVAASATGTPNAAVNVSDLHNTADALRSNEIHIAPTTDKAEGKEATHYKYDADKKQVVMTYQDGKGNDVANKKAVIDLSSLADSVHNYGFKANATGNGSTGASAQDVANGTTVNFDAGKNLTVKQTVDATSKNHTYSFALKDDVVIGAKGENGKDGIDGSIGVNGKDGSAVAINGKDGSIGLNGENGKNGLTIKGDKGAVGVDGTNGKDGKDGMTRIVYTDNNNVKHEVATLDDGVKYAGDDAQPGDGQTEHQKDKVIAKKLNNIIDIIGGADKDKLSDKNIGVNNVDGKLKVQLAKELKGLTSAEFNDGKDKTKTEITHNGIAITPVNPANGKTSVTLTDEGLNNGGNTITNVAEGKNGTDAVNVNQLNKVEAKITEGGLTFAGNSGTPHKANLNTTVNIKGGKDNTDATQFDDGKNVMTTVNKNTVTVAIKKTPEVEGINIIDKDGKVKVKLTQTNEGLKVSDGNDKETRITNVAEGKNGTDAVNVKQLNAAKTEVTAGDNIDVVSRTGANGQTIYKVSAKGINDTSAAVKAGSNHVEVTKAANTHKDGSTTVTDYTVDLSKETKEDIKKGVDAHTEVTTKGLTFNADHGTTGVKKLGSKVAVNGDGKNITTTADENGVKVSMKDDIKVNSVTAKEVKVGDVNINENGINAGGKRITNVAPGKDGTDAVNVNQLKYVAGNISNQINNVDKGLRAGIAGALASGGLYHVTTAGKSMVSVGAGTYRGQNALAVGYSRLSDNGKVGVKFTVNSNSQGHAGASASVGYQW